MKPANKYSIRCLAMPHRGAFLEFNRLSTGFFRDVLRTKDMTTYCAGFTLRNKGTISIALIVQNANEAPNA